LFCKEEKDPTRIYSGGGGGGGAANEGYEGGGGWLKFESCWLKF
jgi:hypothetical protein